MSDLRKNAGTDEREDRKERERTEEDNPETTKPPSWNESRVSLLSLRLEQILWKRGRKEGRSDFDCYVMDNQGRGAGNRNNFVWRGSKSLKLSSRETIRFRVYRTNGVSGALRFVRGGRGGGVAQTTSIPLFRRRDLTLNCLIFPRD